LLQVEPGIRQIQMSKLNSKNVNRKVRDYTKNVVLLSKKKKGFMYYFVLLSSIFFTLLPLLQLATASGNGVLGASVLLCMGIAGVLFCVNTDTIELYHDKIEIISFWGSKKKTIIRKEILTWNEVKKAGKYVDEYTLIIQTKDDKYKVSDARYDNYEEIKNKITRGVSRGGENQEDFDKRQSRFDTIVLIIALTFLVAAFSLKLFWKPE